jgi:hypothetical protein
MPEKVKISNIEVEDLKGITPISSRLIMVLIFVLQVALAAVIIVYILE